MLAYFVSSEKPEAEDFRSTPMVLKIAETGSAANTKLQREKRNADVVRQFVVDKDRFALPVEFSDGTGSRQPYSVLWSRFTHGRTSDDYWLGLDDLHSLLKGQCRVKGAKAAEILPQALQLLRPLHCKGLLEPKYIKKSLVEHYRPYLRDLLDSQLEWPTAREHWATRWQSVWAPPNQENIRQFGNSWRNPFWVLDQLRRFPDRRLICGVVHGDLHPRNIVIAGHAEPHLIDFGWAGDRRHITQDFVLLECNLRFFVQEPALPFHDARLMSSRIGFDKGPQAASFTTDAARERAELIDKLRQGVRLHFPPDTDWDVEYVVPLFLTSLGLLKHMTNCENQLASQLTVLSLGGYISKNLLPRGR